MTKPKKAPIKKSVRKPGFPSPLAIVNYLENSGWNFTSTWQGKIEYYENPQYPEEELKLTVDETMMRFNERTQEFLIDLSRIENRALGDVIAGIKACEPPPKIINGVPEHPVDSNRTILGHFKVGHTVCRLPDSLHPNNIKKYRAMVAERAPEIIQRMFEIALTKNVSETNLGALNKLVDAFMPPIKTATYINPVSRDEILKLKTLTATRDYSEETIGRVDQGALSLEEGEKMMDLVLEHKTLIEASDIEPRMRAIEEQIKKSREGK